MPRGFLYYGELLVRLLGEDDYGRHLDALAEALPIEVVATDRVGRVIVWNAALAHVAGPRERALGRPLLEALPVLATDPNRDWAQALREVLEEGRTHTVARQPLGSRVVRLTMAPMRDMTGEVLGCVLAFEDITSGARAADMQRQRERTALLQDLGASLAHEIRNPLNALSLNLQLLAERMQDARASREDLERGLGRAVAETRRMEALVTHLLEVSRDDRLRRTPAKIDVILESVLERLEGMAQASGCRVAFMAGSSRTLLVDPQRIDRALHNLLRNAIEAAATGGGHVLVTTRDDPHSTVVVVDDDGPGIRPEERSDVFVLYTTSKRGGTGLGLPLAREDVRRHGGEIEVLARPGGGARFVVHLPPPGEGEPAGHEEEA
ncbi:MAG: PAS domain-containing protein [Planctomycetes bacterium]|nr:PAS domain-containing protein [Planctomycetota bacterium]MCB9901343.1 PAS domain-containing protein [Planctomycetota bacterium]